VKIAPLGARLARRLFNRQQWPVVLALLLLVLALAMPPVMLPRETARYIVTFDITQSMDTEDVGSGDAPASRLEFARAAMRETLGKLPCGSKVGWSVFTGQRTLMLVPPIEVCGNFDALLSSLNEIDGRMRWTNWSRVAEGGIYSAVRTAQEVGLDTAVIFVTDGQEAPPVLPSNDRVREMASGKVHGWLIGVGGDQPANIPKTDANGNRVGFWRADEVIQVPTIPGKPTTAESHEELSQLRGEYLASVASRIGFKYQRLVGAEALTRAMLDRQLMHREPAATNLDWCPALLALLLLTWRFLPSWGLRGIRLRRHQTVGSSASTAGAKRSLAGALGRSK
jgi:mxaL protein